jgi:3-oxoacyl-[acyl-carrier-protein] synthase-3
MGVRFKGWGIALPDRVVTNDELSQTLDTSDEWITERTGIRERRIGGSSVSLGVIAGRNAIEDAGLLVVTSTSSCSPPRRRTGSARRRHRWSPTNSA